MLVVVLNEVGYIMQVVLPSAKSVADLCPQFDEIQKCPGRGIIVSGLAPPESGFDFYSRYFCPKLGIHEVITRLLLMSEFIYYCIMSMDISHISCYKEMCIEYHFCFGKSDE